MNKKQTSKILDEQANKYEGLYYAIGLHPEFCNGDEVDLSFVEELFGQERLSQFVQRRRLL